MYIPHEYGVRMVLLPLHGFCMDGLPRGISRSVKSGLRTPRACSYSGPELVKNTTQTGEFARRSRPRRFQLKLGGDMTALMGVKRRAPRKPTSTSSIPSLLRPHHHHPLSTIHPTPCFIIWLYPVQLGINSPYSLHDD